MDGGAHGHAGSTSGGSGETLGAHAHRYEDHGRHSLPGGLSIAAGGFRLVPDRMRFEPGSRTPFGFEIRREDGTAVTEVEPTHGKLCHLLLVRRDLVAFQHLHPRLGPDGRWSQPIAFPEPGVYRAFVDVRIGGRPTTLGTDLFVRGSVDPAPGPGSTRRASARGYTVRLHPETIDPREETVLSFAIERDGEPVDRLEPHLEALGHLVALREGDLGYLHTHPDEAEAAAGEIRFQTTFPTAGSYRLFLQAKPEGELVTVPFDVSLADPAPREEDT